MIILHVNKVYPPHGGGIERVVQQVATGLNGVTAIHRVLCCRPKGAGRRTIQRGVEVIESGSLGQVLSLPLSLSFFVEFWRQSRRADIVHLHEPFPFGTFAALLLLPSRVPLVVTWYCSIVRQRAFNFIMRPALRAVLLKATIITTIAEALKSNAAELEGVRDKCRAIPIGLPLGCMTLGDETRVLAEHLRSDLAGSRPLILFVGRLVYYKGLPSLIEAMRDVDAVAVIVGEGPLRAELEARVRDAGVADRVRFCGYVADELLPAYYAAADLFVFPSNSIAEAFGIVQVQALAAGKPVVNTQLPTGVCEVSRHGETGLTVRPDDPRGLAGALNTLLENAALRASFGAAGRRRFEAVYTESAMFDALQDAYRRAVAGSRTGGPV